MTGRDREWIEALYRGEVAFMDDYLAALFEAMESDCALEGTLVVFLSDHGEEFLEHGGYQHGETLYEEQLRIPLIVALPGAAHAGQRVDAPVSTLDVAPTVLDVLGIEAPETMRGQSLRPYLEGVRPERPRDRMAFLNHRVGGRDERPLYIRSLQREDLKLVWTFGEGANRLELYDLGVDPAEQFDLLSSRPVSARALHEALVRGMATLGELQRVLPAAASRAELSEDAVEALRALGYVE